MKIQDGNPVRFDSGSCFNVCAAGRVDRRTAMSSGHRSHSSAATSLAFVGFWLIRAVDRSRTARIRFRVFLVREVLAKTLDRLRREYYDLKRFVLTEKPSAMTMLRSVRARCAVLRTVGRTYVRRFSSPARASAPDDSSGRPEIGTWSPR